MSIPPASATPTLTVEARADSARWFAEEVQPHHSQLGSYLRGSFPAVRDIDDVVQESYLRIWQARAAHPIQYAKAFLFKVARHVALDFLRREKVSPVAGVMDFGASFVIDDKPGVVELVCAREEVVLLARAIDTLPARCREIVILRKLKGVAQKEIARRLGIAEPTVQVQVARGMRRCDRYLREHGISFVRP